MRVTRLFVDHSFSSEQSVPLSEAQAHYLMNVLRMGLGDPVQLFNGRDGEWRGLIDKITRRRCSITLEKQVSDQRTEPDLWLIFAPIKRARIDFVATKATELGVSALIPVFTEFTDVSRVNTQRLQSNAMEAAEQCGRLSVPEVDEPVNLSEVMKDWPEDRLLLYCDETGGGISINEYLAGQKATGRTEPMAILIGPEGGFSRSELDLLKEKTNFTAIDLGPRILRADTAAVAALSCWQSVLGDWASE
ncbi:MAG: 16S rRNA (uracil(1498)-N(3))-methyltransferase [Alphaproteobacteria bacterium]|nr:16S rRNA (uracil(1498)-N(3))-methyltransferase [Alphaproteobacteria bacterium]